MHAGDGSIMNFHQTNKLKDIFSMYQRLSQSLQATGLQVMKSAKCMYFSSKHRTNSNNSESILIKLKTKIFQVFNAIPSSCVCEINRVSTSRETKKSHIVKYITKYEWSKTFSVFNPEIKFYWVIFTTTSWTKSQQHHGRKVQLEFWKEIRSLRWRMNQRKCLRNRRFTHSEVTNA